MKQIVIVCGGRADFHNDNASCHAIAIDEYDFGQYWSWVDEDENDLSSEWGNASFIDENDIRQDGRWEWYWAVKEGCLSKEPMQVSPMSMI